MTVWASVVVVSAAAIAAVLAALVWAMASSPLLRELRISAFEAPLSSLA